MQQLVRFVILVSALAATGSAQTANTVNIAAFCAPSGSLNDSCLRAALLAVKPGEGGVLQVPAGTIKISSLSLTTPNLTIECLAGAVLQPAAASGGIDVSADNITFDGCTLDMQNLTDPAGIVVKQASGFTFKNGSIINIGSAPGVQLYQTKNATIDHNRFATVGTADAVLAYGPTTNIHITNNSGIGSNDVLSGRNAMGKSSGVYFTGNALQPVVNKTILTTGDFSDGFGTASPVTNIVITGNTCNIVAASPSVAPFGCFSLVGSYDLTFAKNTMNAKGQYLQDSLLELGASRSTVSSNTFNQGDDPGAQKYDGIVLYRGNVTLSQNIFTGSSAYGATIHIYPQANANGISISGGSISADNSFGAEIVNQKPGSGYSGTGRCSVDGGVYTAQARCTATVTRDGGVVFAIPYAGRYTVAPTSVSTDLSTRGTPAIVQVGRARNQAIQAACNQSSIPVRVTGIAGSGPSGPVTSASISEFPGANAAVGGGFRAGQQMTATGGSGNGLKLEVSTTDSQGGVGSLAIPSGGAGSGYKVGDTVYLPAGGSQIAAEALGIEIGGGLTVSGAWYHAVDVQGYMGTRCPVSASIQDLTINGPNETTQVATGVFYRNAAMKLGTIRLNHVARNADGDR
jgi:hypothetical protein